MYLIGVIFGVLVLAFDAYILCDRMEELGSIEINPEAKLFMIE